MKEATTSRLQLREYVTQQYRHAHQPSRSVSENVRERPEHVEAGKWPAGVGLQLWHWGLEEGLRHWRAGAAKVRRARHALKREKSLRAAAEVRAPPS